MDRFDSLPEVRDSHMASSPHQASVHLSRKTSWGTPIPPPSSQTYLATTPRHEQFDNIDISNHQLPLNPSDELCGWVTLDSIDALGLSFDAAESPDRDTPQRERFALENEGDNVNRSLPLDSERPFDKWVKHIQRKATQRRKTVSCDMDDSFNEWQTFDGATPDDIYRHKKSASGSSSGFVTAVREASISLASISIAPRSRRTGASSRQKRTDRSSKTSNVGRLSEDSSYVARSAVIDQGVTNRLLQRRRVLEEIIRTEESYLADVKFLMNVYVTLMVSIPTLSSKLRASINVNLNEIVELHEEILGDLHRVVPHSEYTQAASSGAKSSTPASGHNRWRSLDAVPENSGGTSWLQKIPGMTAEPKVAANVAKVFGQKMKRFFIYEEYGAKYEVMIRDLSSAYRTTPQWEVYQKGLEALASSLSSANFQRENPKKALTTGDLLVKPIQRVCKYPLLFAELLKQTPVCDCPDSHMEIENVLIRLREATSKINHATDDPRMKAVMEKSWLLQDRLEFADKSDPRSKSFARGLGHIHLCGVLHVSWQTRDGVDGQYMICLLYRDFLLLASATRMEQIYTIHACVGLTELNIEEVDNGRGLQCHTAPFSWKIVFQYDHRLFEITMSACSPKEEFEWRTRLADHSCKETLENEYAAFASLSLDIKPMGTIFGKPGTVARRISIHRATTVGPATALCQVIIKNTSSFKDVPHSTTSASINRSQSLLTTNRIPVLAPARGERIRLENLLSDVWSRDILPFPSMTSRIRNEHPVRVSASSMMRKLSVASIASNFTKRSASIASLQKASEGSAPAEHEITKSTQNKMEFVSNMEGSYGYLDDSGGHRILDAQDDKENAQTDSDSCRAASHRTTSGTMGSMRRLATLNVKTSWANDGHRMITPPLRTSSAGANSLPQGRTTSLSTVTDTLMEEKESPSPHSPHLIPSPAEQRQQKLSIWKGTGRRGIRNLFR